MKKDITAAGGIIGRVVAAQMTRAEAAAALRVSVRTIHNYEKRYLNYGFEGLIDHRRGHFRKITPEQEAIIVACKLDGPNRSAHWIRNHLKLDVSVEAVRLVLEKHRLNRTHIGIVSNFALNRHRWEPF